MLLFFYSDKKKRFIFIMYCSERGNLPPGSKCVRLCLACQALENMSTSGGRSYNGPILSLARRNLPHVNFNRPELA